MKGDVKFNDGFVVKIEDFEEVKDLDYQSFEITETNVNITIQLNLDCPVFQYIFFCSQATLTYTFYMNNVIVLYDILLDLDNFRDTGVVEFNYKKLEFSTKIISDFKTGNVKASLKYSTFGSIYDIGFRAYPYHYQMQIIGSEVRDNNLSSIFL